MIALSNESLCVYEFFLILHFRSGDIFVYCVQWCEDVTNCYRATYSRYSNFPFVLIDTFLNEWNTVLVWRENYFTLQNTRDAIWNWKEEKKTVQIDRFILRTHMSTIWITVIRDVDIVFIYNFACSDYKRIIWLLNNKRNIYSVWRFEFFSSLINSHCVWHVRIKFNFYCVDQTYKTKHFWRTILGDSIYRIDKLNSVKSIKTITAFRRLFIFESKKKIIQAIQVRTNLTEHVCSPFLNNVGTTKICENTHIHINTEIP